MSQACARAPRKTSCLDFQPHLNFSVGRSCLSTPCGEEPAARLGCGRIVAPRCPRPGLAPGTAHPLCAHMGGCDFCLSPLRPGIPAWPSGRLVVLGPPARWGAHRPPRSIWFTVRSSAVCIFPSMRRRLSPPRCHLVDVRVSCFKCRAEGHEPSKAVFRASSWSLQARLPQGRAAVAPFPSCAQGDICAPVCLAASSDSCGPVLLNCGCLWCHGT